MSLYGKTNEEKIWNFLTSKGLNAYGVAGLMGNLYAESALNPQNLQNTYERSLGFTDAEYTAAVDSGSYSNFVRDAAGYGLAQWTYWSRKEALLAYVKAAKASIGDLETQLCFLFKELSESYTSVLAVLKTATSVKQASDVVLTKFERPADQSDNAKNKRASFGQTYFDKYAAGSCPETPTEGASNMNERQTLVNAAVSYIGCNEADGSHKQIIDLYNSHKPLARGYAVKYTDAWCATFVSAMAIKCGMTDIIPTECGCGKMIDLFKKLGAWQENDAHVPQPGDVIFYDWDDSGSGDNTGGSDHVGIVEKVSGSTLTVIEGNYSNAVKRRPLTVNGKYIRGYGVPKYKDSGSSSGGNNGSDPNTGTGSTSANTGKDLAFAVGDVVQFTGSKHYASANATSGPACKAGKAKITAISKNGKHPYHVIAVSGSGSNVYGWVDEDDVKACSTALAFKVGDVVQFTGSKHYTSASASSGKACKAGKAKVTAVYPTGKHPYHLIAVNGSGSNVYGWVDVADVEDSEISVGDVVQFAGGPHYASANAKTYNTSPKAGPAKVTAISKGAKHPYHLVHTDKQSAVYGWVDADKVSK